MPNDVRPADTKCTSDQKTSAELKGFDIDVAVEIAKRLGVEACFVTPDWTLMTGGNWADRCDVSVGSMTIIPERNLEHAFVGPYFISGKSVLATAKSIKKLDETAELNSPETRLAYIAGSTSEIFVTEVLPRAKSIAVQSYDEGVKLIIDRTVDALVTELQHLRVRWRHAP